MNSSIKVAALLAMAVCVAGTACAQEGYIGLSRTTPGEAYVTFGSAKDVQNYNNPLAMKLYGGVNLSERYAVELGYGFFGDYKVADPAPGSTRVSQTSTKLIYVAAKATIPVGDSFSLFAKAGLAANKFTTKTSGYSPWSGSFVRPMYGAGMDYKVTEHVAAVLEFNYYGARGGFTQRKLELGLKAAF